MPIPPSGVAVYDSYSQGSSAPWLQVGGTSLSSPCWAGLIAIADQLRASQGLGSLDGRSQTLANLYGLAWADYHDITSGNNGSSATARLRPGDRAGHSRGQQARARPGDVRSPRRPFQARPRCSTAARWRPVPRRWRSISARP